MPSERIQRQIDRLLDEAEEAVRANDWPLARQRAEAVLDLNPENIDAPVVLAGAERATARAASTPTPGAASRAGDTATPTGAQPTSSANGRYEVQRFLGEGGKKKVYLAHDTLLDRNVAFALIKTEGLDGVGKERITREAQAMGRLGDHPNIVTVYDIGTEDGQPYLVLPLLPGGDIEGLIENAPEHRLPIEQVLKLGIETCQGLEFAHAKGIVHRDLKPGNVWLDEAGRAKIGDFGLAVAVDRSRLTQAGMMVGTVNYMPPEQAMGGEVTARSDLYSFGAMLYEMVCGRPPFLGDENVAIIGQHLNTPPVAPTWHRPDCPPALETLILRLLEKDPSRRPPAAGEVRQALESLTTGVRPTSTVSTESPQRENPLYRRVFVGREGEVRQLQAAFDAALSGQGGLVMVVGEPGIGKTAVCEQLATYVAMRGGRTLAGHCYEEGSLSQPYLAFVEAMRSYVLAREPDGLRSELGTGAADVARIVSEIRDRTGVELRPAGDPEDDRWRLLQAVTTFLRNASTMQPLLIMLEDLHWADRGTLDLLLHVARNLLGARLLIVGNYRDVEVDRSHPLSHVLGDLRRIGSFHSIRLRGLSIDEVQRMMTNIRGQDVPVSRAELIHRQTEGNPLFVQEVLRYLVEEGITVRQDGRYQLANPDQPEAGIPEGLRDVIGKRLSRLSPDCNRLLAVAAVIGREFDLATLRVVANVGEEQLIDAIEEAVHIGVLEERSRPGAVLYRFAHSFFRQTLYEEMIAPRRLRLHQEVARALESQYGSRRDDHAAELAEHFAQSTDRNHLAKAVEYSELSARRALSVYAYAEAASHLERCLAVEEVLAPDDKEKRMDLLLALGEALMPAGEPQRVVDGIALEALKMAEAGGDEGRASRACVLALRALFRQTGVGMQTEAWREWALRADSYAKPDTPERIHADISLATVKANEGHLSEARDMLRRALELARALSNPETMYWAASLVLSRGFGFPPGEKMDVAEAFRFESRTRITPRTLTFFFNTMARTYLVAGDRASFEAISEEMAELAESDRDPNAVLNTWMREIIRATLDGRLDVALETTKNAMDQAEALGIPGAGLLFTNLAHLYLGVPFQASEPSTPITQSQLAREVLFLSHSGRRESTVDAWKDTLQRPGTELTPIANAMGLELAILERDVELANALMPTLADRADHLVDIGFLVATGRLLGEGAALLDRPDEARIYYDQALRISTRLRFRPETALTRLGLAELLLEHYPDEHDAAIEHLDFAIAEFREMKMQPSLERALRHRGLLKA